MTAPNDELFFKHLDEMVTRELRAARIDGMVRVLGLITQGRHLDPAVVELAVRKMINEERANP